MEYSLQTKSHDNSSKEYTHRFVNNSLRLPSSTSTSTHTHIAFWLSKSKYFHISKWINISRVQWRDASRRVSSSWYYFFFFQHLVDIGSFALFFRLSAISFRWVVWMQFMYLSVVQCAQRCDVSCGFLKHRKLLTENGERK